MIIIYLKEIEDKYPPKEHSDIEGSLIGYKKHLSALSSLPDNEFEP
jgi:hypothetical protein